MRRRALASLGLAATLAASLGACAANDPIGTDLAAQPVRIVFFEDDSIALGPAAMAVIEDAVAVARRYPLAPVRVAGFIAPDPLHAPTVALSRARAEHVANEMVRLGVARARIQVQGRGLAPVAEIPLEARRVEIRIGPG